MIKPLIPVNEKERLINLKEYNILDTFPEEEYDAITQLASFICKTPISLITIIDENRQWFKSHHGTEITETPREYSFCAHAINDQDKIFIVPNSKHDERFHDNPFASVEPAGVFYAGVPLISSEGFAWGTLCVIDKAPKILETEQIEALKILSKQVVKLVELRQTKELLEAKQKALEIKNTELSCFAHTAAHDLKSPLNSIIMMNDLIKSHESPIVDPEIQQYLDRIYYSANKLAGMINGILDHSKSESMLSERKTEIDFTIFMDEIVKLLDPLHKYKINYPTTHSKINSSKFAMQQIFINLISNAIKYNDKSEITIDVDLSETKESFGFSIKDNGRGIRKESINSIFDIFKTEGDKDRFGNKGNGIGLATVKKLAEGLGGKITVDSELGAGTTFKFSFKK